jgi:aryl-alcohol dehydrogenase-like predicted oxidoreductase
LVVHCTDSHSTGEASLGKWFTQTGRRSDIFLATKFGAYDLSGPEDTPSGAGKQTQDSNAAEKTDHTDLYKLGPNSKPSYIERQIKNSLSALNTDYIDLYYQHRVDPEVPIEVVLETLRPYVESGKIRWLGLSECSAATLKRAKAVKGIGEKVVVVQMEFSPFELGIEKSGFVDVVNELGMAIVAYSPLARGLVTGKYVLSKFLVRSKSLRLTGFSYDFGRYRSPSDFADDDLRKNLPRFSEENFPKNLEIVERLKVIADKYNATTSQVALAWILAEHSNCSSLRLCPRDRDLADRIDII